MEKQEFRGIDNNSLTGFARSDLCYFGFWKFTTLESEQNKLFSELEFWAKKKGHQQIYGPIDGSTLGPYRLRINYFSEAAFWGEPANSEEPVRFLRSMGYEIAEKYFSYVCHDLEKLRPLIAALAQKIPASAVSDLSYERLRLADWPKVETELCGLANQIFSKNFAFSPMTLPNFRAIYTPEVREKLCEETSILIRSKTGDLIGFCVNFRDPGNPHRIVIKTAGVAEPYRRMGFTFFEMIRRLFENERLYQSAIICLMREGNVPSLFLKDFADEIREYALFRKNI